MKCALTLLCGLVFLAGCDPSPISERAVTQGTNPAFSPDGSKLAFQRLDGDVFKIGVTGLKDGRVEWIEEGPGNAAYPEWTPSGGLIYMAGHDTETAYEAWHGKSKNGYGLWLWENGSKRRLTSGRCRDYTPSVSPDGRKVYFVTTRGVTSESSAYSKAASSRIAELDLTSADAPTSNSPSHHLTFSPSPSHPHGFAERQQFGLRAAGGFAGRNDARLGAS